MKGLLIKDLKLIMSQRYFLIMAIGLGSLLSWTTDDVTFAATYIILLLSMLTLTTLSYDNINGGMLFILSLPVSRKLYVKEKYVFAFLNLVFAAVITLLLCFGIATLKGTKIEFSDLLSGILGITVGVVIMLGIMIPLELKFGVEKARIALIVTVVAIVVVAFGTYKLLTNVFKVDVNNMIGKIVAQLPTPGEGFEFMMTGVLLVIVALVLSISYVVSNKILRKEEF